jgi:hypothetical protein
MTGLWLALTELFSRQLETRERDAVLGDLAEAGVHGARAWREVSGLVVRRQVALWYDWRPWVALLGMAIPIAFLLRMIAAGVNGMVAINYWTYSNFGVRYGSGLTAWQDIAIFASHCLALIFWAWTTGFALAKFSRRTAVVNGAAFYLVWLFCMGRQNVIAFLLPAMVCVLPSLVGLVQGLRTGAPTRHRTFALAATALTLCALVAWTGRWQQTALELWSGGALQRSPEWTPRIFAPAIANMPAAYLVWFTAKRRRRAHCRPEGDVYRARS